jgi:hypothetical protein
MIVAGSGGVFFLNSFLPWHRGCVEFFNQKTCNSESAWGTPFSIIAVLLAVAVVAEVVAVQMFDQRLPAVGTFAWSQIRLVVTGAILALVVLQLLVGDDGGGGGIVKVDVDPSFGLFIGLALAAGMIFGTFGRNKESEPASF